MKRFLCLVPALLLIGCTGKSFEEKLTKNKKLRIQVSAECLEKYDKPGMREKMPQDERCKTLAKVEKPLCEHAMSLGLIAGEECDDDEWLVLRPTAWEMVQEYLG